MGFRLVSDSNRFVVWNVKQCCWWLVIHKGQRWYLIFLVLTHSRLHWKLLLWKQSNKWKKLWCFLPWLVASSWQDKSLDWEMKAFSVLIPRRTKGNSWPAVHAGRFRRNPAICALRSELLAASCEAGLEQSRVTGCWHCFLVASVKKHLIYMLCHMRTASSLGPHQDSGRESQVMSLGLAHPWQTFKLSACLGVDDIHLQLSFVNVWPSEDS